MCGLFGHFCCNKHGVGVRAHCFASLGVQKDQDEAVCEFLVKNSLESRTNTGERELSESLKAYKVYSKYTNLTNVKHKKTVNGFLCVTFG